ncbi:MAG: hypothetical protein ABIT38_09840 [Gemmatimonadaceae bacterium]
MRLVTLFIALGAQALLAPCTHAQQQLSGDQRYQALVGRGIASLIRGGVVAPHWLANGRSFWFTESLGDSVAAWKVDPVANTRQALFDTNRLRKSLATLLGREISGRTLTFSNLAVQESANTARMQVDGEEIVLDLASYETRRAPVLSSDERDRTTARVVRRAFPETAPDLYEIPSPNGKWFLGERDHNIWLRDIADGGERSLTTDGTADQTWSIRVTGALAAAGSPWANDGSPIVVMRNDSRGVAYLPVVHWLKTIEEVELRHFTKAGGPMGSRSSVSLTHDGAARRDVQTVRLRRPTKVSGRGLSLRRSATGVDTTRFPLELRRRALYRHCAVRVHRHHDRSAWNAGTWQALFRTGSMTTGDATSSPVTWPHSGNWPRVARSWT